MSRKKKTEKVKPGNKAGEKNKSTKNIIIVVAAVLAAALVVIAFQLRTSTDKTPGSVSAVDDSSLRKGETRETLPPAMFADPFIAGMYQVAKDIPHVLDSVRCYCYCERDPFYHVSLLSCFVDKHAAA